VISAAPATDADLVRFYGTRPPCTVRAMAVRAGDEIFGVVGLARLDNAWLFFSDYRPEFKWALRKSTTLKAILKVRDWIRGQRVPVVALRDPDEPDSDRLLTKFGFVPDDGTDGGLYRWHS
jgi:hypothetical protein